MMLQRPGRLAAFAVLAGLFFAGPSLVRYYTDWLWFGEVGYQQVFFTMLRAQGTLFTVAFVLSTVWLTLNFRTAVATIRDLRQSSPHARASRCRCPAGSQLRALASGLAVIVSVLVGLFASSQWETWLTWRNAVPSDRPTPMLGRDVSFYVFSLPSFSLSAASPRASCSLLVSVLERSTSCPAA